MNKENKELKKEVERAHKIWNQFSNWLTKKYGKDLVTKRVMSLPGGKSFKYNNLNKKELSKRLVGYNVMEEIENYIKRYCKEIKIIYVDDAVHASSMLLLIPHPKHGITIMFIPQCTSIQNEYFLYEGHCNKLIKYLTEMKKVYKK